MAELAGRDLDQLDLCGAGDLERSVARAGVDHQHLVGALICDGLKQLAQISLPILDGDHDRDPAHDERVNVRLTFLAARVR